mmetsp:Transcript_96884/g.244283  ORF Transcript_96884/g.244283 Transcript_96884/m.244283 type:complete len:327 (-) Transcript_96884:50-1030(-)
MARPRLGSTQELEADGRGSDPSVASDMRGVASEGHRSATASASTGGTGSSHASAVSWVSAPPSRSTPQCFLPRTAFQRPDGTFVRAAELKSHRDVLLGPAQRLIRVLDVAKHLPQERDIIHVVCDEPRLSVTPDHRLLIEGCSGGPVAVEARSLMRRHLTSQPLPRIFDGNRFHVIHEVRQTTETTQLVDVCLDADDAAVLAWQFPKQRPRSISTSAAVACLGRAVADRVALAGAREGRTFLDGSIAESQAPRLRIRSAGSAGDPRSAWSAGTTSHDPSDPARCQVCRVHHRFMQDAGNTRATPCRHGASCRYCHAPHPERGLRIR